MVHSLFNTKPLHLLCVAKTKPILFLAVFVLASFNLFFTVLKMLAGKKTVRF